MFWALQKKTGCDSAIILSSVLFRDPTPKQFFQYFASIAPFILLWFSEPFFSTCLGYSLWRLAQSRAGVLCFFGEPVQPVRMDNAGIFRFVVGMVADDPGQQISLKAFHAQIINDHETIAKEEAAYQPLPEVQQVSPAMIHENYERIRLEVQGIIEDYLQTVQEMVKAAMVDFVQLIPAAADADVKKRLFTLIV